MTVSILFIINVIWVQGVIIIIILFCWHYFESCYAGNWHLAMTHHKAVGHLLESERRPFSKIHISQKKKPLLIWMLYFFLRKRLLEVLKTDRDPHTGWTCYFLQKKKPPEEAIAALRTESNSAPFTLRQGPAVLSFSRATLLCHATQRIRKDSVIVPSLTLIVTDNLLLCSTGKHTPRSDVPILCPFKQIKHIKPLNPQNESYTKFPRAKQVFHHPSWQAGGRQTVLFCCSRWEAKRRGPSNMEPVTD